MDSAKLIVDGKKYEFPILAGTEGERAMDIRDLRDETGLIAYDPGYANVGSCRSTISFVDGEAGVLRYRGYPIEDIVAHHARFSEVCYLLVYGKLPNENERRNFSASLTRQSHLHDDMKHFFDGYPPTALPMTILSAMVASLGAYYQDTVEGEDFDLNIVRLIAKAKTIAAYSYKRSVGEPYIRPLPEYTYSQNFLHMMFSMPDEPYEIPEVLDDALNLLLILHADHEQNCSTSTVRMVGSSRATLFASISAGIAALGGYLHGGANQKVIEMLEMIRQEGGNYQKYIDLAKDKSSPFRLFGFGHRVYKNYDPRARIMKETCDRVFNEQGIHDPLLDIAKELEERVLQDDYFIERKLYPNLDFYSGIIYRAMGIPKNMFPVMFALGRVPGWIAQWKEMREDQDARLHRPRQIYIGETQRPFVPLSERP
jgi:citrate synthase